MATKSRCAELLVSTGSPCILSKKHTGYHIDAYGKRDAKVIERMTPNNDLNLFLNLLEAAKTEVVNLYNKFVSLEQRPKHEFRITADEINCINFNYNEFECYGYFKVYGVEDLIFSVNKTQTSDVEIVAWKNYDHSSIKEKE